MIDSKTSLYSTKQIRLCEQNAAEVLGLTADELMQRAGNAAFRTFLMLYPNVKTIAVFCGAGNNGGDGYVFAEKAHCHGLSVIVYPLKPYLDLPPSAKHAALSALAAGVACLLPEDNIADDVELIVDALLGIGLAGPMTAAYAQAICLINDSGLPVLAMDIPSGLHADTGRIAGVCVQASVTTTFIGRKLGMYTADGPDYCGKIVCHDLQLTSLLAAIQPAGSLLDENILNTLPARRKNSHKGMYGHVLVIGGNLGMPGAVWLAAMAALHVGAGAVTVATRRECVYEALSLLPEAMVYTVDDATALQPLLAKATVCIIGPGLGDDQWAQGLFRAAMAAQLPLVLDASALRLLADSPQHDDHWILTPHPGEAAALLACSAAQIQDERVSASQRIQKQYGGCVVLKGAGTVVNTGAQVAICNAGNPGMASAGMGDVLTGILGGLLAQGLLLDKAALLGVWLHARAGDDAGDVVGQRGLRASDLMPYLRRLVN